MPEDDHLDRETSVSVAVTESGVTLKAKSRLLAGFDRLGGNLAELFNLWIEEENVPRRQAIEAEKKLNDAAVDALAKQIAGNPERAQRVVANLFKRADRERDNLDGVMRATIEDLRGEPPTEEEAASGPDELSQAFTNRFETYAREASTEELRERWGRVLASEIRKPGTFSQKVLRIVDELDADVAQLFESVCKHRLGNTLPKALVGDLAFLDQQKLVSAELITEPGAGQIKNFFELTPDGGLAVWASASTDHVIGIAKAVIDAAYSAPRILNKVNGVPAMPIYVLTTVGTAIATILPDQQESAVRRLAEKLKPVLPSDSVFIWRRAGDRLVTIT